MERLLFKASASIPFLLSGALFADVAKPLEAVSPLVVLPMKEFAVEDVTTVNFIKGGSALSEAETLNLKAFYESSREKSPLTRITVLSWSDREGMEDDSKAIDAQITLAQKRAESIKEYLVNLSKLPVESVNMASDAGWIAKAFGTREAKVKDVAQSKDAESRRSLAEKELARIVKSQGGVQKALVIVEREDTKARGITKP